MWSHFYEKVAHKINFNNSSTKFWSSSPLLNPSVFYDTVIFMSVFWQSGTFWRRTTCRCIKKWNWTTTVVDATWYSRTPLGTELRSTGLKIHLGKISTKLPSYCFGTGHASKLDEFSEKFQTAFDPPPPPLLHIILGKLYCNFFRKTSKKSPLERFKICKINFWIENDPPAPHLWNFSENSSDLVASLSWNIDK